MTPEQEAIHKINMARINSEGRYWDGFIAGLFVMICFYVVIHLFIK